MSPFECFMEAGRIDVPEAGWKPRIHAHAERARLYLLASSGAATDGDMTLSSVSMDGAIYHLAQALHGIAVRQGNA